MTVDEELRALAGSVRRLKAVVMVMGAALIALPVAGFTIRDADIIRVKGIIVEDAEGRARILIGAPAPQVEERVRTNPERARAVWGESGETGGRNARNYQWARLRNEAFGMLILDENGHDSVAIGSPVPDPLNGRRIAPSNGMSFANGRGVERGGMGYMYNADNGIDRTTLGLDSASGEGVGLIADKDGTNGLWVHGGPKGSSVFTGLAQPGGAFSAGDEARLGLMIRNADNSGTFVGAGQPAVEAMSAPTP